MKDCEHEVERMIKMDRPDKLGKNGPPPVRTPAISTPQGVQTPKTTAPPPPKPKG